MALIEADSNSDNTQQQQQQLQQQPMEVHQWKSSTIAQDNIPENSAAGPVLDQDLVGDENTLAPAQAPATVEGTSSESSGSAMATSPISEIGIPSGSAEKTPQDTRQQTAVSVENALEEEHADKSQEATEQGTTSSSSTSNRGRARPGVNSSASTLEVDTQRQLSAAKFPFRKRTMSSPPGIRRSKSTPRPLHIPSSGYPKATNSAHPHMAARRQGNAGLPERPLRSAMESETGQKLSRQTSANNTSSNISSSEKEHVKKKPALFSELPFQTYLHLALSSPEDPAGSMPSLGPAPVLEMKYPYVPSDSPDLILERITNFVFLPPYLEKALLFGMMACLDSWLHTFTILPLRFAKALWLLVRYWISAGTSFWNGGNRLRKKRIDAAAPDSSSNTGDSTASLSSRESKAANKVQRRGREKKISGLLPQHKADLLKGAVVTITCFALMRLDPSRMYHSIRGQAAIKLYIIYNVLEVGDRLLSALGQDVFECLFSRDTLERKPNGRSKVWRPFWCFLLAAGYNILHSTCLFYQMVTLNVAVNSYSNALLTLLLSSQFVEIKSTVFKKFEKENLFQMTCADVVERFQLWMMLSIIVSRNLIEVGVRNSEEMFSSTPIGMYDGSTHTPSSSGGMVIPKSFLIFPSWAGQVFGPFFMVLGSETVVDWLKHAYITKFNQLRPKIYDRFLDVLCRDYYSCAFTDQRLTRRFGLPVIPLACVFIRASLQTYNMFLATHASSLPLPSSTILSDLSVGRKITTSTSPAAAAALTRFDSLLLRALGRTGGYIPFDDDHDPAHPIGSGGLSSSSFSPTAARIADTVISATTFIVLLMGVFAILLALKMVIGMALVGYARGRYHGMKERDKEDILTGGRRVGGFGLVEVDEGQRRIIYADDKEGGDRVRGWEIKAREKEVEGALGIGKGGGVSLDDVERYSMCAKRIW